MDARLEWGRDEIHREGSPAAPVSITATGRTHEVGPDDRSAATRLSVLHTKLEPPTARPGIIERPRLLEAARAAGTSLVALIAPAGYGKSSAMAQIARAEGRPVAWLSADARDSDPAALARSLAASLHAVAPLPEGVIRAIEAPGRSLWAVGIPRLASVVAGGEPITIAIDDVDRIDDDVAMSVILTLADHLPPGSRLLLAGRTPGRLPQARLVAQRQLSVLGREQLALDTREAEALLAAAGRPLPDAEVRRLTDHTEGWAAGVYLSALASVGTGPNVAVSPAAPERQIEEYLRTEVLGAMAPDDADLLIRSSILERLSGPLCDAVLGRTRTAADLDRLERANLFLIPLDAERTWYRTHHLLGEYLRRELDRTDPGAIQGLLGRAAAWHEEHGIADLALEYAIAAGDEERAARLTVLLGQAAMNRGRGETVRRWFDWFEARSAGPRLPGLASYAAMALALEGDADGAQRWMDIADDGAIPTGVPAGLRATARVLLGRDGVAAMLDGARMAVEVIPESDPWRVAAITALGISSQLAGDTTGAREHLAAAVARYDKGAVANNAATLALIQLAATALDQGDRSEAEAHVRKARGILVTNGLGETAVALGIDALDARISVMHGAARQARTDMAHAQRLRAHVTLGFPWLALRARADLIRAYLGLGDAGGARTLMAEVREILAERPDMGTLVTEAAELEERLRATRGGVAGSTTLTIAELRLLPLLTTHLSFREIGERLFVSQNTVKTQAISIYRKLDATSRGEAIDRAVALGLLESSTPAERFIPAG